MLRLFDFRDNDTDETERLGGVPHGNTLTASPAEARNT
jgi:hypothetical protein